MTATLHVTGQAVTTANHRSLNVNFLNRTEQGTTTSATVPSIVDPHYLEPAAVGNVMMATIYRSEYESE